jgi:hypothetical protein
MRFIRFIEELGMGEWHLGWWGLGVDFWGMKKYFEGRN